MMGTLQNVKVWLDSPTGQLRSRAVPTVLWLWFSALNPDVSLITGLADALGLAGANRDENAQYIGTWRGHADNGFKEEFKDGAKLTQTLGAPILQDRNNNDQSHHFAFFFQLAFRGGSAFATEMGFVADPGVNGDSNLAYKAVDLATRFKNGSIAHNELGNSIRNEICNR